MKNSPSIKIFYLILWVYIFTCNLPAQISPGDLTNAHAKYEGLSNCTKCHILGKQVQSAKCLVCHTEIQQLISSTSGYHSWNDVKTKECWSCHSEHHGRNFRIINFNPDGFDHNKSGFHLDGKHSQLKCTDCHQDKFIANNLFRKRQGTYLGLSTDCTNCHEDVHQNTLGKNCSSCHNQLKFVPAVFFNHDKTKFKLTDSHTKVDCIKCHIKEKLNEKSFQKFTGLQFSNCTPCHQDVHKGEFGINCVRCHNEESFKSISKNSFDHNKTNFPLEGAHARVLCADCHGKNILAKLKFSKCTDCHKDAHFGEFIISNQIRDCKNCHSIESFKVSLYAINEHNKINFQLSGAHLAVDCKRCHFKEKLNQWHFKNIGLKCIDCHENVHGSELNNNFMPDSNCTTCHSIDSWKVISFDHNKTEFKILGKHKTVSCGNCHVHKTDTGMTSYQFASLKNSDCISCHRDIHLGQFSAGSNPVCEKCHGFDNWKPEKFNHENTLFPLKGAHEKISCSNCHKKVQENGNEFIKYKLKDFKCAVCHA
jgi:nitrate/TMAO reductase-like tetraheme cytochrome c subunit